MGAVGDEEDGAKRRRDVPDADAPDSADAPAAAGASGGADEADAPSRKRPRGEVRATRVLCLCAAATTNVRASCQAGTPAASGADGDAYVSVRSGRAWRVRVRVRSQQLLTLPQAGEPAAQPVVLSPGATISVADVQDVILHALLDAPAAKWLELPVRSLSRAAWRSVCLTHASVLQQKPPQRIVVLMLHGLDHGTWTKRQELLPCLRDRFPAPVRVYGISPHATTGARARYDACALGRAADAQLHTPPQFKAFKLS